jgi:hypothetical protein
MAAQLGRLLRPLLLSLAELLHTAEACCPFPPCC